MTLENSLKTDPSLTVVISSDHGAVDLKAVLTEFLSGKGFTVKDYGVVNGEKADYPDMALPVVEAVLNKEAGRGILLCGSGLGISMAANRFPGIRAALCHDEYSARMSRLHNDANILVMGGRNTGVDVALGIAEVWFATGFEGGRHTPRIEKIDTLAVKAWKKYISDNDL